MSYIQDGQRKVRGRKTREIDGQIGNTHKSNLIRVADLSDWEPAEEAAVGSGFLELDQILDGGFRPGELTVWSGVNSSGKSALLSQMLLEALDQEQAVCAYSGELPDQIFRYWLELQAAGPRGVETGAFLQAGRAVVSPVLIDAIRVWYRERLFLCAGAGWGSLDNLLETFTGAARDYSCRVFLLDNLTIIISGLKVRDQLRTQRELILHMVRFARDFGAHVHVVVHPRKNVNTSNFTKMDIGGSGDITNLADNVLVLTRFAPPGLPGEDLPPAARLSANINHVAFHDLRHTVATLLLQAGESTKNIQELLGHSDIRTTLGTYAHVIDEMKAATAEKLNSIISGAFLDVIPDKSLDNPDNN